MAPLLGTGFEESVCPAPTPIVRIATPSDRGAQQQVARVITVVAACGLAMAILLRLHGQDLAQAMRALHDLRPAALALASALSILSLALNGILWTRLLRRLGSRVHLTVGLAAFLSAGLAGYAVSIAGPAIGSAMVLRRHGLGPRRAVLATLLANALGFCGVVVWVPLGMAELLHSSLDIDLPVSAARWPIAVAGILALTTISLVVIAACVRWPGGRLGPAQRLLERHMPPGLSGLRIRTLLTLLPWAAAAWLAGALALYALLDAASLHGPINPGEVIGAAALATTLGSLAFFVPAGIGIRDGAMVTLLIHGAGLSLGACASAVLALRAIDLLTKAGMLLALRLAARHVTLHASRDADRVGDRSPKPWAA